MTVVKLEDPTLSGGSHGLVGGAWLLAPTRPYTSSSSPNQKLDLGLGFSPPLYHPLSDFHAAYPGKSARKLRDVASWHLKSKLPIMNSAQLDGPRSPRPLQSEKQCLTAGHRQTARLNRVGAHCSPDLSIGTAPGMVQILAEPSSLS